MIRILGTIFAGLLGLAFGSFLNVCLSRWPQGESIVHPRSHCRNCDHQLSWWENIPLISWLALRGCCRNCHTWIGWRYPLVEFTLGILWAVSAWNLMVRLSDLVTNDVLSPQSRVALTAIFVEGAFRAIILFWILLALAILDAEHLWLPDRLTIPGIVFGYISTVLAAFLPAYYYGLHAGLSTTERNHAWKDLGSSSLYDLLAIFAAALLILAIRWIYKLIRHREGIGLGDAKLMALLAAWLGLPGALLAFFIGVVLGALVGVALLLTRSTKQHPKEWSATKLPLGTFLCIGGILSALWGQPIIASYLHWAGF
jgi:leader peptidase (prepilin peptidase)/N-methyltransferase